ncbi:2-oxoglutarate dehydrogenase E1 component [Candidatus Neptunichlamydia sp. REUL1]|uniref:2-oxoglutarate dehydrogenase E1 component n=1 Tax=Candidatus Neptunichlamydia sp. REUL1 TaxID=3064277 RepID=UPI00292D09E0|nr:2-oxoglutarate dehydrogenase E1 component [Candidatus Neptunochlamydia sp. REUL1]
MSRGEEYANLSNLSYIEGLYAEYVKDPNSVEKSWQHFFEGMALGSALKGPAVEGEGSPDLRVFRMIEAYRIYGHKGATFNPIDPDLTQSNEVEELKLETLGFKKEELGQEFPTCGFLKDQTAPLSTIIDALNKTYCSSVGFEYMGMQTPEMARFFQQSIEPFFQFPLSREEKIEVLHHLNRSEILESFIHMKYPGQKRFSLEGGETLIPMLMEIAHHGSSKGIEQIVLGMAHRGRLNVLTNVLGKPYSDLFREFEKTYVPDTYEGSGDVKYHMGYSSDLSTKNGKSVHLALCANPSHLEAVDPVVEGKARAKQEEFFQGKTDAVLPVLIHGDASIAGQGVVYETMQLSKLAGYQTGGTMHIVINNQVGFTAAPKETKSTPYCTDIAKSFGAPVFHVNAEDPERAVAAMKLAVELRQKFGCDVFIELNCHRKYGHNESDEPAFTQPEVYKVIKQKQMIRNLYRDALIQEGTLSQKEAEALEKEFKDSLEEALKVTQEEIKTKKAGKVKEKPSLLASIKTAIPLECLTELAKKFTMIPSGFALNPKLKRLMDDRIRMISGDKNAPVVDWGMAEHLAYATLLTEGVHVRLSGQDSGRGTFSHRHAALTDQETSRRYYPLSHLSDDQANFDVYNSPLSEYAVMGFEYGYSLSYKKALTLWEGQFGDFANGAQIVIDQFIVSAEQKWGRLSPLTLLLPHGYEGQGPEHSSARIERFLQLAANDSLYIVYPSTPAQHFHALRRQGISERLKPLILFTPKALLRYPPSLSMPKEFAVGEFQEVIDDPKAPKNAKRLIFCSGKVYYDLIENNKCSDIAIVRIEQLYPLHAEKVQAILKKYNGVSECFWVQEEPQNQGAYSYIQPLLQNLLPEKLSLRYVGRDRGASTAAGTSALHSKELEKFLKEALE